MGPVTPFVKPRPSIEDMWPDETKISHVGGLEICTECNATEQGFTYQAGNPEIPICNICGMEATKMNVDEDDPRKER